MGPELLGCVESEVFQHAVPPWVQGSSKAAPRPVAMAGLAAWSQPVTGIFSMFSLQTKP